MGFWKDVHSPKNTQSWGRVSASLALVFGLAWITRLVLLITGPEQYEKLGSLSVFIGAVVGMVSALYGISKGLDTLKSIKGGGDAASTSVPPAA